MHGEMEGSSRKDQVPRHAFPLTLPQLAAFDGVSSDWLSSQLTALEKAVDHNESLRTRLIERRECDKKKGAGASPIDVGGNIVIEDRGTDVQRLAKLKGEVESLSLAADFAACRKRVEFSLPSSLFAETQQSLALAKVLSRHEPLPAGSPGLYRVLLDRYKALHKYVRARALLSVRRSLRKCNYPAESGCDILSDGLAPWNENCDVNDESFSTAASALVKLQLMHDHLMHHIGHYENSSYIQKLDLIDELCRPVVKRVCYHFVENASELAENNTHNIPAKDVQDEPPRSTGSRLDCLPQWLFHYMKDVILEGPYDFLKEDLQPLLNRWMEELQKEISDDEWNEERSAVVSWHEYEASSSYFLSEMVKACEHVLEARNFFQDPSVVGKHVNPTFLSNAIEQMLMFDSFISNLLIDETYPGKNQSKRENTDINAPRRASLPMRPPRLVDNFFASNAVLLGWWASMDKHYMLSMLSATSEGDASGSYARVSGVIAGKLPISPTAETFLSLLHSARTKAEAIGFPDGRRTYVAKAIVPLCMHFMDSMHKHASAMRDLLIQRKRGGAPPTDENLRKNFVCWIELITGTHLASAALSHGGSGEVVTLGADEDLARVGRSLERLCGAMVDECGSSFVETVLSERAKLASYLMRCPHMLSSRSAVPPDHISLSPDLNEVAHILCIALGVCDEVLREVREAFGPSPERKSHQRSSTVAPEEMHATTSLGFAAKSIDANIARRLEEKLLEVALDIHDMVPVIGYGGAQQFQHDMQILVGAFGCRDATKLIDSGASPTTLGTFKRLFDATAFMSLDDKTFFSLREAIYGLVRSSDAAALGDEFSEEELAYDVFAADGTLSDEARSMLRAKGFSRLNVEDALSVLKRRSS
uniref:Uncharacterized protein n=1 Tax=Odontella aurita TaxID=265563 RepID=A0A7S4M6V3_9STRA|mmetsp:Transcript_12750/g.37514  ORF Transcript_12750/g.37514 Transcript_12750/m.37514 type:complete len:878 (+) Transcript_12750:75-2708(+)